MEGKKLVDFLAVATAAPFKWEVDVLRADVEAYASQFPLPGLRP
jgi:hypothetical protein